MARTKAKDSPWSFGGLGLDKKEEEHLIKYLEKKDMSLARFKRFLIRQWLKTQTIGEIKE